MLIFKLHCCGNEYWHVCNFVQSNNKWGNHMEARPFTTTRDQVMIDNSFKLHLSWGGYRIVEKGLEIRTAKDVPCMEGPGAFSPGKIEFHGNMNSSIVKSSQCVIMSQFFLIWGIRQSPPTPEKKNPLDPPQLF